MRLLLKVFLTTLLFTNLISCSNSSKDADKVGDAQSCLDKLSGTPTVAQVSTCTDKVSGLNTAGSNAIMCSAMFLLEGFGNPQRYADALTSVNNGTGSTTNNQAFAGILTFAAKANLTNDLADTSSAFQYCQNSGGKGATLLSSFSYITMALYNYLATSMTASCPTTIVNTGSYSYYNFSSCVTYVATTNLAANAASLADMINASSSNSATITFQSSIGAAIIATYNVSCQNNTSSSSVCSMINNAVSGGGGTSNPRGVAVYFINNAMGIHN